MTFGNLFLPINKTAGLPHIEQKFPQDYDLKSLYSFPAHPKQKRGVCIILGTHPCAMADFDAARKRYPNAKICAINDAVRIVNADFLATAHPEKIDFFLEGLQFAGEIHSRERVKRPNARNNEYVWDLNTGGGSALFASAIMLAIGFQLVIMCGCPMDGGGGYLIKRHESTLEDPRFGDLSPHHIITESWQNQLRRFKEENTLSHRVRSMSGTTREIFGGI